MIKKRRDCTCPCHKGAPAVLHVVPCCDAVPVWLGRRKKSSDKFSKRPANEKKQER